MQGYWLDLGLIPYKSAFDLQERLLAARMEDRIAPVVLLQECPKTFTIGRSGSPSNILASKEQLEEMGIEALEVSRGGDVTYHGPGQIIASPLFYLGDLDLNGNQYMHRMEDVLIELLAGYGIEAYARPEYPGVWANGSKVAAVGLAVKHGYTFHGISLNVDLDLSPFKLINPCGMPAMPVTSMDILLGREISQENVKLKLRDTIEKIFNCQMEEISEEEIRAQLA